MVFVDVDVVFSFNCRTCSYSIYIYIYAPMDGRLRKYEMEMSIGAAAHIWFVPHYKTLYGIHFLSRLSATQQQ